MAIQSIIQGFQPARKFLLLIGLFIFCLGLASLMQVLIILPYADLNSVNDIVNVTDFTNPSIIKGMKIAQAASAILGFIIPALIFAYFSSEKKISYLKINRGFNLFFGIVTLLLVFSLMPLINWMAEVNSHLSFPDFMSGVEEWMKASEESLKKLMEAFMQMNSIGDLFVNLAIVALLAAVGEELFFRGAMQNVVFEWTKNSHTAVWVTAILFSAFHMQFYGFLPRVLLGVILGYLYIWSRSLWVPILFHFLNNALAVSIAYLIGKGIISDSVETVGAGETPILYVLASIVTSAGLIYFVYKSSHSLPPEGT